MPSKRRRSERINTQRTKKRRHVSCDGNNPLLPYEIIEHIIRFIPHHKRDNIAFINKHWSKRVWHITPHKHSVGPTGGRKCTCEKCHGEVYKFEGKFEVCPCPRCLTVTDVERSYEFARQMVQSYRKLTRDRKQEYLEDLEHIHEMTDRSVVFRYRQIWGIECEARKCKNILKFCVRREE